MTKSTTLNGTPSSVSRANPYFAPPPLCETGPVLGIDPMTGRDFRYNPWELRRKKITPATTARVTSMLGGGKTASFIIWALRFYEMQAGVDRFGMPQYMRERIEEKKPEAGDSAYKGLKEMMDADLYRLDRAGSINPFAYDEGMTELDMLSRVLRTCQILNNGENLDDETAYSMQVAVHMMMRHPKASGPGRIHQLLKDASLDDERDYSRFVDLRFMEDHVEVLEQNQELAEEIRVLQGRVGNEKITEEGFRAACLKAMLLINKLLNGGFGNIFGSQNGLQEIMRSPLSILDWYNVPDIAREVITRQMWEMQMHATRDPKLANLIPHLVLTDEAGKAASQGALLEYMAAASKDARAFPTFLVYATQFELEDMILVGEAESRARVLAKSMEQTVGTRFIGQLGKTDKTTDEFYYSLGIESHDLHVIRALPPGCFAVWIHGQPLRYLQIIPRPLEWPLIDSDHAARSMAERSVHEKKWTFEELIDVADMFAKTPELPVSA